MAMSFTLVASCREALSGVVSTRLIREQEAEDAKTKAYEEVSLEPSVHSTRERKRTAIGVMRENGEIPLRDLTEEKVAEKWVYSIEGSGMEQ
jgi:hypothetical protein